MRNFHIIFLGIAMGFMLMFGFNPSLISNPGYDDDVSRNTRIGGTHPVGEKFGGGVKIHDFNGDTEIDIDPTGPGGN